MRELEKRRNRTDATSSSSCERKQMEKSVRPRTFFVRMKRRLTKGRNHTGRGAGRWTKDGGELDAPSGEKDEKG